MLLKEFLEFKKQKEEQPKTNTQKVSASEFEELVELKANELLKNKQIINSNPIIDTNNVGGDDGKEKLQEEIIDFLVEYSLDIKKEK